jgi:hypothetical protein
MNKFSAEDLEYTGTQVIYVFNCTFDYTPQLAEVQGRKGTLTAKSVISDSMRFSSSKTDISDQNTRNCRRRLKGK